MAETIHEGGGRGMHEAMEVGEPPEGGGPRQYRRADVEGCRRAWRQGATIGRSETIQEGGGRGMQEAMEVGEPPEGGRPRQYKRAEVEGRRRAWK